MSQSQLLIAEMSGADGLRLLAKPRAEGWFRTDEAYFSIIRAISKRD
jgi:hypothetical protein